MTQEVGGVRPEAGRCPTSTSRESSFPALAPVFLRAWQEPVSLLPGLASSNPA
jgi:hypothetical protein